MFNITKVCKELRGSHYLYWYREDDTDYVANGYFLIKTNLKKEENRKILGGLVELFGAIPEKDKGLQRSYTSKGVTITNFYRMPEWMNAIFERKREAIEDTRLIETDRKGGMRIFKGEEYIYVNMKYIELIKDVSLVKFEGGKALDPITAIDREELLLILPIRLGCQDNEYLVKEKDLSSGN